MFYSEATENPWYVLQLDESENVTEIAKLMGICLIC
jgi:hypothetical protein